MLCCTVFCFSLCAQEPSIEVVIYKGEKYLLYPEKQRIGFNPTMPIWEKEIKLSREELKKYKWHERRFFRKDVIATTFPLEGKSTTKKEKLMKLFF